MTRAVPSSRDAAAGLSAERALTAEDLLVLVNDVLGVVCGVDPRSLTAQTELASIGADSLARVELAEQVEERLTVDLPGLHIPDGDLGGFDTVGDVRDYLSARL